jgi:hypothetical protein
MFRRDPRPDQRRKALIVVTKDSVGDRRLAVAMTPVCSSFALLMRG